MTVGIPVTAQFFPDAGSRPLGAVAAMLDALEAERPEIAAPLDGRHEATGHLSLADVDDTDRAMRWYVQGLESQLQDLRDAQGWQEGQTDERGRGWEKLCADVALKMQRYGAAMSIDAGQLLEQYLAAAPRGGYVDDRWLQHKWHSQTAKALQLGPWPLPDNFGQSLGSIFDDVPTTNGAAPTPTAAGREEVNTSNPAITLAWLRNEIGTRALSGIYARSGALVFTPHITAGGYDKGHSVHAIKQLDPVGLAARANNRYTFVSYDKQGERHPDLLNPGLTQYVTAAVDDLPNVKELTGVVHSPVVRADGTILGTPGYDEASGLLFLPDGPMVEEVPFMPSQPDVDKAKAMIDFMLTDFAFVSQSDRANYIGAMLTPLLRLASPPPYKMISIEAHQPGSGKSFLGRALISLHGGTEQSEMPSTEDEFGKSVAAILDQQTGGVVMFDNVTGVVRSPFLAGLLTQPAFSIRRLGSNQRIEAPNDRLWVMTGNNAQVGGDLARRMIRVMIDPGVPNPENRTGFKIPRWESWVREMRPKIIWSLLVLIRHWFDEGAPRRDRGSDSYADWTSAVEGILAAAGIPGGFDGEETRSEIEDSDAEELGDFIHAVKGVFGERPWTVKEVLGRLSEVDQPDDAMFIQMDAIPEYITAARYGTTFSMNKKLGRWISRNRGRWVDNMCLVEAGTVARATCWRVKVR